MSNNFNTSSLIAREMTDELIDTLPLLELSGNIGESDFMNKTYNPGDTVKIPLQNFFKGNKGMTAVAEGLQEKNVTLTVGEPLNVMVPFNSKEELLEIGSEKDLSRGWKDRVMKPAIKTLKSLLEDEITQACSLAYHSTIGTPGTPISSSALLNSGNALFTKKNLGHDDSMAVLSPDNYATLGTGLTNVFNPNYTNPILRELNLPNVGDFSILQSNYVSENAVGTASAVGDLTVAATMTENTKTIQITGTSLSGKTFLKGNRFQVAAVNEVTPYGKKKVGIRTFVNQADVTAASDTVTLTVDQEIIASATNPRQNVDALPQLGAEVTLLGDHTANFLVKPNSMTVVCLKMPEIMGAENGYETDTRSQTSIRVTAQGSITTSINNYRVDILPAILAFGDYGAVIAT